MRGFKIYFDFVDSNVLTNESNLAQNYSLIQYCNNFVLTQPIGKYILCINVVFLFSIEYLIIFFEKLYKAPNYPNTFPKNSTCNYQITGN